RSRRRPCSLAETDPTRLSTLSLHDALPISSWHLLPAGTLTLARGLPSVIGVRAAMGGSFLAAEAYLPLMLRDEHGYSPAQAGAVDRKSTRLNSSHVKISYAVFCL